MAERLATWVWIGMAVMAFVAGIINVVGFLGFEHQSVSHLTGTASLLGAAVVQGDPGPMLQLSGVIASFVGGAVLSGLIIQDSTLRLGRRYGFVLMLEAIVLTMAVHYFKNNNILGGLLAALACGLQNAMVSTYSGSVVRTTHLSGMFTDLGIFLGHALRGMPVPKRRLALCLVIISTFFLGGLCGAMLFRVLGYETLFVPAIITGLTGFSYFIYHHMTRETDRTI